MEIFQVIPDWIKTIILSSGTFASIFVLFRKVFETYLTNKIAHSFQLEISTLESELRSTENEISDLRKLAFDKISGENLVSVEKRFDAVENIWNSVLHLSKYSYLARQLKILKIDAIDKRIGEKALQNVMEQIGGGEEKLKDLNTLSAESSRIYISPLSWALYTAYLNIISVSAAHFLLWTKGISSNNLITYGPVIDAVREVFPEREKYFSDAGIVGVCSVLDEVKEKLLAELKRDLSDEKSTQISIEKAKRIMKILKKEHVSSIDLNQPEFGDIFRDDGTK